MMHVVGRDLILADYRKDESRGMTAYVTDIIQAA